MIHGILWSYHLRHCRCFVSQDNIKRCRELSHRGDQVVIHQLRYILRFHSIII